MTCGSDVYVVFGDILHISFILQISSKDCEFKMLVKRTQENIGKHWKRIISVISEYFDLKIVLDQITIGKPEII